MAKISSARLDMEGGRLDNVQLKRYGEVLTVTAVNSLITVPARLSEKKWASIAAGATHAAAITVGGQLWAWGLGTSGQLGQITAAVSTSSPVQVASDKTWSSVAASFIHTAAVTTSGQMWTWGLGTSGQLGNNTAVSKSSPVQIASDKTWASVASGGTHTAAITTAGALWAWGLGTSGQLGQITAAVSASSPVQVASNKTWASVAVGVTHTAAITTAGALWMWGLGASGQLGQITGVASTSSPVQVASDKTWSVVAAGISHTLAVTTSGQLWAWGGSVSGQLGDNTVVSKSSPVQIASDKTWASVAAGVTHTVAMTTSGQLWAWGAGGSGQLGDKNFSGSRSSPVQVTSDKVWSKIATGGVFSAALTTAAELYSWGTNTTGALGNPAMPVTAGSVSLNLALSNVWKVYLNNATAALEFRNAPTGSNYSFTLILEQDSTGSRTVTWPGTILWNGGIVPALTTTPGRADVFHFTTTDGATWFAFPGVRNVTGLSLSSASTKVWAWGNNSGGQVGVGDIAGHPGPTGIGFGTSPVSIASGYSHVGVISGGQAWVWGLGASGQLGQITTATSRSSPVQVGADKTWSTIAAGPSHTVATTTAGALWGWGLNLSLGSLGQVTTAVNHSSPVQIASDKTWTVVKAGGSSGSAWTIGITSGNQLWAWGSGAAGQLGQNSVTNFSSPVQVASDKTWSSVAAGSNFTAGITTTGQLWTWGVGSSGQLGSVTSAPNTSSPVQIATDKTWSVASGGSAHMIAITTSGQLWAWGQNSSGQIGDNTVVLKSSPVQIASDKTWSVVAAGISHTLAVTTSGQLWAWGGNSTSQLGTTFTLNTSSPVQVGGTGITWSRVAAGSGNSIASST